MSHVYVSYCGPPLTCFLCFFQVSLRSGQEPTIMLSVARLEATHPLCKSALCSSLMNTSQETHESPRRESKTRVQDESPRRESPCKHRSKSPSSSSPITTSILEASRETPRSPRVQRPSKSPSSSWSQESKQLALRVSSSVLIPVLLFLLASLAA
jgi:hypothetical protein